MMTLLALILVCIVFFTEIFNLRKNIKAIMDGCNKDNEIIKKAFEAQNANNEFLLGEIKKLQKK